MGRAKYSSIFLVGVVIILYGLYKLFQLGFPYSAPTEEYSLTFIFMFAGLAISGIGSAFGRHKMKQAYGKQLKSLEMPEPPEKNVVLEEHDEEDELEESVEESEQPEEEKKAEEEKKEPEEEQEEEAKEGKAKEAGKDTVVCAKCGEKNPPKAKFCEECGTKLPKLCPGCGEENKPAAKFCEECGMKI